MSSARVLFNKFRLEALILTTAIAVRIFTSLHQSLHIDEALQARVYREPLLETLGLGFSWGHHPPLDFIIGWFLERIGFDSILYLRLPSILFGAGSVLLVFLIVKRYLNIYLSFLISAVSSFSPEYTLYSAYIRPYTIFIFFFLFALYRIVVQNKINDYLTLTVLFLLPLTRGHDGVIASCLLLLYAISNLREEIFQRTKIFLLLITFECISIVVIFYVLRSNVVSIPLSDSIRKMFAFPANFYSFLQRYDSVYFIYILTLTFIISLTLGFVRQKKPKHQKSLNTVALLASSQSAFSFLWLFAFSNQGVYERYLSMTFPSFALGLALIVKTLNRNLWGKGISVLLVCFFAFKFIPGTVKEVSVNQNYPFEKINEFQATHKNLNYAALLLGSPNQYVPGWPTTPRMYELAAIPWVQQKVIFDSISLKDINALIILSSPPSDLSFKALHRLPDLGMQLHKVAHVKYFGTSTAVIVLKQGRSITDVLDALDRNIPKEDFFWGRIAKIISYENDEFKVDELSFICQSLDGQSGVDFGNNFGIWGSQLSVNELLKKLGASRTECD